MSEFEKQDQEVMGLVNRTTPQPACSADGSPAHGRQGQSATSPAALRNGTDRRDSAARSDNGKRKGKYLAPDPEADEKAELQRQWLLTGIKVAMCAGGVAMLVGILKEPELVPAVVNFGVACFVGVAAVILDRTVKRL